jgi:hypothetical protein
LAHRDPAHELVLGVGELGHEDNVVAVLGRLAVRLGLQLGQGGRHLSQPPHKLLGLGVEITREDPMLGLENTWPQNRREKLKFCDKFMLGWSKQNNDMSSSKEVNN